MANEIRTLNIGGEDYSIIDTIYPVGSIYMSVNSANPATLFGGTWEQIQDTFLLAAGQTYSAGATGGEAAHTLSEGELPEHSHMAAGKPGNTDGWWLPIMKNIGNESGIWGASLSGSGLTFGSINPGDGERRLEMVQYTGATGNSQAHNNMPPYLSVYVWKRTA